jgi:hypothetical protein
MTKNKIFLGGTCADTAWRDELIRSLNKEIGYFNPVVEDWTPECQRIEEYQKNTECNIHFYFITSEMKGVFSIAEVIDSAHTKGKRTILQIDPRGFEKFQLKSLEAVVDLVNNIGGIAYIDEELHRASRILNNCFSKSKY